MTASTPITPDAQQAQQDRKRKRKAILAGGVVLGLGAAITLAAWSDDVFANGTFQTGGFNLVGSQAAASDTYNDYAAYATLGEAADLTTGSDDGGVDFSINSLNLSPGETVVAPFSVATSEDTTVDGRYWLETATATGPLAPFLQFAIVQSANCAADVPTTVVNEQTSFATPWKTASFGATQELQTVSFGSVRLASDPGPDIALNKEFGTRSHLCIGVTLADNEDAIIAANADGLQGNSSITWAFAGESLPLQTEDEIEE